MSDATTTGPAWRALVIQHERPTPPGLIEPWLGDRGAEVESSGSIRGQQLPTSGTSGSTLRTS